MLFLFLTLFPLYTCIQSRPQFGSEYRASGTRDYGPGLAAFNLQGGVPKRALIRLA